MLDTFTLRVAFGLIAACVLVLFYAATYRPTRSAYSGWWCVSLACFVTGALLYLCNGTPLQVVANPMGNTAGVLGAGGVWAAARSLRGRAVPVAQLVVPPVLVLAVALLDDPAHDVWTGGAAYLLGMAGQVGRSSWELRCVLRERDEEPGQAPVVFAVRAMAVASGVIAAFYLLRAVVFVVVGAENPVFVVGFGPAATTLMTLLLLVVVTFSMATLGHAQQTTELRVRATRDGLTGLLNRSEFLRAAQREVDRGWSPAPMSVLLADLDDFKTLNDRGGHAAGDAALRRFAEVCETVLGAHGIAGRLGGDEFVMLVPEEDAERVATAVCRGYAGVGTTVSIGIAPAPPHDAITDALEHADAALYRAKADGRDRAVHWRDGEAERPGRRTA
ncbi:MULTISPECIES: GGDEF domain-containing protein [unclassified Nocardioides]|uniref:GGDEF domain-containing protein n=1 Tax=unclassified Nocardioides TaxID=2615069 RepID=UPI000702CE50|nr:MULTISPECIES: GGDEF domain-containing protein [unclassified Nocardioides]KRC46314.1 hypothetical protein ASE19_20970 [Nocardioides sp. Root79]KRC69661.1 hypothetical protein ASE20_13830 [Nocardioides sp. Root240]